MEVRYVDSATAAELLGVTERAVRKRVAKGSMQANATRGELGGGRQGEMHAIPLPDVLREAPIENRLRWFEQQSRSKVSVSGADLGAYGELLGPEALETLAKRQQAVLAVDGILNGLERGKNAELEELAAEMGCTTRTLRRWHAAYLQGGLAAIMDKVERRDKGQSKSLCSLAQDLVEARMCDNHKHPQNSILEDLERVARECGPDACAQCPYCTWSRARRGLKADMLDKFPACGEAGKGLIIPSNRHAINRFVKRIPDAQLCYARYGKRAWEAKFMQKCKRTREGMLVNSGWFGDHKKLDLFVLDELGRIVRPWLTAWMDAVSGKFTGWALTLEPNSDTVIESLKRGILPTVGSDVHGYPCALYIDNGKDYRSSRLEGATERYGEGVKLNEELWARQGMMQTLGIETIHAKEYHGWPKTIERAWETLDRWIRYFPGWCGDSPKERPEDNSRIIKRLVETGKLMTFETFAKCFAEDVLPKYHAFKGSDGLSPDEIYAQTPRARSDEADPATIAILCTMRTTRSVTTQGVRLDNILYAHPALTEAIRAKEKVTVCYNRGYNQSVTVLFRGKFLCEAERAEELRMFDEKPEKIAQHIANQRNQEKAITDRLRQVRQATGGVYREMYAEAIDEQRAQTGATVISLEARKIAAAKDKVAVRAAGKKTDGQKQMEEMLIKMGRDAQAYGAR